MSRNVFIIVEDPRPRIGRDDGMCYFVRLGLGIFWECCHERASAKEFATRTRAVKMMQACGKHREGWRVVSEAVR